MSSVNQPTWLKRENYPFESHYLDVPDGRMHYIDEGDGEPLLMLHGTPTWSYLFRYLAQDLRDQYRVIALDHLGFGLSDKPSHYSYKPQDQAKNISSFIEQLGLENFTLAVHDFGEPLGLSYAIKHPKRIKRLIIFNTWLWSLKNDFTLGLAGKLFNSPIGKMLFLRFNFEVTVIFPSAFGDRSKLTPEHYAHYRNPIDNDVSRQAIWTYAKELITAHEWYDELWSQREILVGIPMLIAWGMKDPVLGEPFYQKWVDAFPMAKTVTFEKTGHYVPEEQGAALTPIIRDFLNTM